MESSYNQVKNRIISMIRDGNLPDNRLYSEGELVDMLGASRATIREVLRSLEIEGIITKRHGVGTFVHPQVLNMPLRIDQAVDFSRMIEDMGYEFGMISYGEMKWVELKPDDLETYIRVRIGGINEKCLNFSRIYTAGGTPAALCSLYFPEKRLTKLPSGDVEYSNVDDFCKKYFSSKPDHSMIFLSAANADETISKALKIPVNTAVQVWDELLYDYKGELLGYSRISFTSVIPAFSMLRR